MGAYLKRAEHNHFFAFSDKGRYLLGQGGKSLRDSVTAPDLEVWDWTSQRTWKLSWAQYYSHIEPYLKVIRSTFPGGPSARVGMLPRMESFAVNGSEGQFVDPGSGRALGEVPIPAGANVEGWCLDQDAKWAALVLRLRSGQVSLAVWKLGEGAPRYTRRIQEKEEEKKEDLNIIEVAGGAGSVLLSAGQDYYVARASDERLDVLGMPERHEDSLSPYVCHSAALLDDGDRLAVLRQEDRSPCILEVHRAGQLGHPEFRAEIPLARLEGGDLVAASAMARFAVGDGRIARWSLNARLSGQRDLAQPRSDGWGLKSVTDRFLITVRSSYYSDQPRKVSGEVRPLDGKSSCEFSFVQPAGVRDMWVYAAAQDYFVAAADVKDAGGRRSTYIAVIPAAIPGCSQTFTAALDSPDIRSVAFDSSSNSLLALSGSGRVAVVNMTGKLAVRNGSHEGIGGSLSADGQFAGCSHMDAFHLYRVGDLLRNRSAMPVLSISTPSEAEAGSDFEKARWLDALTAAARRIEIVSAGEAVFELGSGTRVRVRAARAFADLTVESTQQAIHFPAVASEMGDRIVISPDARWAAVSRSSSRS